MNKRIHALGSPAIVLLVFAVCFLAQSGASQEGPALDKDRLAKFQAAEPEYGKARLYFQQQKTAAASQKLAKCLSLFPEHSDALYLTAQVAYKENRLEDAREQMEKAEQNFALTAGLRAKVRGAQSSDLLARKAQLEKDIAAIQDFIADSTMPMSAEDLAGYQKALAESQQKLAVINAALLGGEASSQEPPADFFFFFGNILFRLSRIPEAEGKYLAALKADPKHIPSINNLANLYYMSRRFEEARKLLEEAEKQNLKVNQELKKAVLRALEL